MSKGGSRGPFFLALTAQSIISVRADMICVYSLVCAKCKPYFCLDCFNKFHEQETFPRPKEEGDADSDDEAEAVAEVGGEGGAADGGKGGAGGGVAAEGEGMAIIPI